MFGWLKRRLKSSRQREIQAARSDGSKSITMPSAPAGQVSSSTLLADPRAGSVATTPVRQSSALPTHTSTTGAAMRSLAAQDHKASNPHAGMAAIKLTSAKALSMVIVGVQADGRRVLAKTKHFDRVYAFTRRSDDSYRLEGAPDRRGARLIIGATLSSV